MLTYPHYVPRFQRSMWTLPAVLEHQARVHADRPCLSWTDAQQPLSYAKVNALVNQLARGLAARGVVKGDYVVLLLPNCLEYIIAWWALNKLGAIEVTVGDSYKGDLLKHQVTLSKARMVITTPAPAARLSEIEDELTDIQLCLIVYTPNDSGTSPPAFRRIQTEGFADVQADDDSNIGVPVSPQDIAAVIFTSGTTGPSKGVLMSHAQLYFFSEEDVELVGLTQDDVYMTSLPLFHANAQLLTVYASLIAGSHCVAYPNFSASDFIGRARRSGATICNFLGATTAFVCAQPPRPDDRVHRLRRIYAAPLPQALAKTFTERFGVADFVDAFGQTEISLPLMSPRGISRPPGAAGVLVDQWFEARLIDPETEEDVPVGEVGELLVRPKAFDIMCSGYLGMPEKTVDAWRNLWFHTGDALRRDAEGWFYFIDRMKDALRRRGQNISSSEVETVIRSNPAIAECAVIGVRGFDDSGEDEVKACIVLKEGQIVQPEEIVHWCDERMASFMIPRFIEFMPALPQTPSQKVRKKELRDAGVTKATWDRLAAGCLLESELESRRRRGS